MKKRKNGHQVLVRVYANPRYRGKHVIVVDDKIFVARSATDAPRLFDRVTRAHPRSVPTLVYVPQADALVLELASQPPAAALGRGASRARRDGRCRIDRR